MIWAGSEIARAIEQARAKVDDENLVHEVKTDYFSLRMAFAKIEPNPALLEICNTLMDLEYQTREEVRELEKC